MLVVTFSTYHTLLSRYFLGMYVPISPRCNKYNFQITYLSYRHLSVVLGEDITKESVHSVREINFDKFSDIRYLTSLVTHLKYYTKGVGILA